MLTPTQSLWPGYCAFSCYSQEAADLFCVTLSAPIRVAEHHREQSGDAITMCAGLMWCPVSE